MELLFLFWQWQQLSWVLLAQNGNYWFNEYYIIKSTNILFINFQITKISKKLQDFLKSKKLQPVIWFENLTIISKKEEVSSLVKPYSGIYIILNHVTIESYIGSAKQGNFYNRFHKHLFSFQGNKNVKKGIMINGLENFSFLILEIVPNIATNNYLLTRENFYIKKYSPEYNVIQDAINTYGWHHTEETRIKISLNYSEERKIMIGNFN